MLPEDTNDRILRLLQQDAGLTYKEMGRKLRLNESTVRKRVLGLKRHGVIRRFMVEVDADKIGYKNRVMLGIDVEPSKMLEIGRRLVNIPETRMIFNTSGTHDFHVVVWTVDRDSLSKVVSQISDINGVLKVSPSFMVERLK